MPAAAASLQPSQAAPQVPGSPGRGRELGPRGSVSVSRVPVRGGSGEEGCGAWVGVFTELWLLPGGGGDPAQEGENAFHRPADGAETC